MNMTPLQQAAQDLITRWDSPAWKDQPHTAEYIAKLRKALDAELQQSVEPAAFMTGDGRVSMAETVNTAMPKAAKDSFCIPLYLHPPQQAEQVPMTDDQIIATFCTTPDFRQYVSAFKAGVKLAEKYHGIGDQP